MPSISLIDRLRRDYPQFRFQNASVSRWSPSEQTVYYNGTRSRDDKATLLHELGHALRGHERYHQDIELLRCEREAWEAAKTISSNYGVAIDTDDIEANIETYREWLHARSRCPTCGHSGLQHVDLHYHCVLCGVEWLANDARQCGLKRYTQ